MKFGLHCDEIQISPARILGKRKNLTISNGGLEEAEGLHDGMEAYKEGDKSLYDGMGRLV